MPANLHIIISQKSWKQRVKHLSDDSFVSVFQYISFSKLVLFQQTQDHWPDTVINNTVYNISQIWAQ